MKRLYDIMRLAYIATALLLVACTDADEPLDIDEGTVIYPTLSIGVSELDMTSDTRATAPMSPDLEKYVRTMAIFEFDNEGLHERSGTTHHFIDFVEGTIDGKREPEQLDSTEYGIVKTTLNGLAFEARSNGTLCFVANVTQTEVDNFYEDYREDGQTNGWTTLDKFKEWSLPFDYIASTSEGYDESTTGHIRSMYMFGYFEGNIVPSDIGDMRIDLGRLASRLDITIVNETGSDITKRLGYHIDNLCTSAFFFPMLSGMPAVTNLGLARTVICAGDTPVEGDPEFQIVPSAFQNKLSHTRYFYVAAHSAEGYQDATKLHLFYDRTIPEKDREVGNEPNSYTVPLCNIEPWQAADVENGYSLSRNTRYHFTIRLKDRNAPQSKGRQLTRSAVEYGSKPGEITIYLPIDQ